MKKEKCIYAKANGEDVYCVKFGMCLGDIMGYDGYTCKNCVEFETLSSVWKKKKEKSEAEYLAFGEMLCEDKHCRKCPLLPLCLKYDTTPKIISKYLNDMKQILH